jgi:hypothetical protein
MSWHEEIERCRPWIEAALEYTGGTHDFDDIVEACETGRMQFWPAPAACAITEIAVYPKMKTLNVFLAGGDLNAILARIDDAAAWGRSLGCTAMTMTGRAGWERVLRPLGWAKAAQMVTMERELSA